MLFDAKFTKCLQKCEGKLKFSTHVLSQQQNTNSHVATWQQRQVFFLPDMRIWWSGFTLRTFTMSLFTLSLLKVPREWDVRLHLKLHFSKNVFIHYNNYCFLNNIIILRGMFFMSNIIAVIKFYKFSNTQSVLSTKYVYILSKNAQENRLIKNTTKVERTLLVTFWTNYIPIYS